MNLPETLDDSCARGVADSFRRAPRRDPSARRLRADETFLRALHHVLFDVHVVEGDLVCVESGQVFPIEEGRPNMMIDESLL